MLAKLVSSLGEDALSGQALAEHIGFDAALSLVVLKCARQSGASGDFAPARLADSIDRLGTDFLRTLILAARPRPLERQAAWESAIRVACLARRIAAHTGVCDDEQAWLAGLSHNLADYAGFAQAGRLDEWLLAADPGGFVADAVRFCRVSPARVKSAHPLVRVLQLAASLIYSVHVNGNVGVRASLGSLGLEMAEVERLQAEADYLAQEAIHRYSGLELAAAGTDDLTQAYASLARASALQAYLDSATGLESLARRGALAMQALFGVGPAVVLRVEGSLLVPAAWWPAPASLAALSLPADFVQSALSRAAGGTTAFWHSAEAEQFPVIDAQAARLLGAETLLCEPLAGSGNAAVLVAVNASRETAATQDWKQFLGALSSRMNAALQGAPANAPAEAEAISRHEVRKAVHEASNPLTIIRNYVNLLSAKFADNQETQRDLAIIGGEIERVAGILQGLGAKRDAASSAEAGAGAWVDVNQVISELVRMSLDTLFLPNKINVQIDLDPAMGSILSQRDPLKQVLLNLAKNAVEAMPHGGKLVFATARGERDGRNCAVITVQDSGPGLPQQVRAQLFQPAVSTKAGEHAGLGLYISHNLVKNMGGEIECDSDASGSTFRIYLPMTDMGQNRAAQQPGSQRK
ncbi:HDOD domain-containing protein [Betaproteobacteria bacterium SCN2]|nr:HDOD domain-containing protein [Betaproteobacteria bacterium SCN2]